MVVGNLLLLVFLDHQSVRTLEEARTNARNLNTAYEQYVVRSLKNIDQLLLFARIEFERDPNAFSVSGFSKRDYFPKDIGLQLALVGADGVVLEATVPNSGRVDIGDREDFRRHVENSRDEMFVSAPIRARGGRAWVIHFSRKLRNADGTLAGVMMASLDPYLLTRMDSIDIGSGGAVSIWGLDGVIRARSGVAANALGQSVSPQIVSMAREANAGVYEAPSVIDDVERIVSFRRVPGYSLVVTVALSRAEALAPFESSKRFMLQLAFLVDLSLIAFMGLGMLESFRLRSAREHLSAKSRMLASTFASMKEGILLVDGEGMIVAANDIALRLLGLSGAHFVVPSPYAQLPLAYREAKSDGGDVQQISIAGGRTVEVKTSLLPDGGFVKTLNDVTVRKRTVAALEDARDKAEAATRARTSFLATMSHEIRTPLGGILSMVDLIGGTKLDPVQKRYVEITRDSATHLLQLIDDVLDVTKLDAGHLSFENISFDLHRQLRSTVDIVSPRALAKGLAIGCVVAPDVPREIMGDPGRLRQVLINLLGNAIKFTASGHVLLDVSLQSSPAGDRLCVRVEDTGIGIARDGVKNLFHDFSQIDSSISRRFGGTGLGLAISRKLVTRMGGSIGVESEPGVGSVFFFDIPLRAVSPADAVIDASAVLAFVVRSAFERKNFQRQFARSFASVEAFEDLEKARAWMASQLPHLRRILLVEAALAPEGGARALGESGLDMALLCSRNESISADDALRQGYIGVVHKPIFADALRSRLGPGAAAPVERRTLDDPRPAPAGGLAGQRVLIAEDNPTNQFALSRMLEVMGAQVTSAHNGREAVELAEKEKFDVVLMDVMMPELDGLEAAREIRAGPGPNADAPIIALTASAFVEDRIAAMDAGMSAFATKPITSHSLLETIVACQARVASAAPTAAQGPVEDAKAGGDAMDAQEQNGGVEEALDRRLLDQLRQDLGPEHMKAALELFYKDMDERVKALRSGDRSAAHLRRAAHALKGSAASFGFRRVAAAAAHLEEAARLNEVERLDGLLEALFEAADAAPNLLAA